jgi:integrase
VVFIIHLKEIKKTIENELIKLFFKKLSSLFEQFIFPTLEFEYFKESLENRRNFNEKEEYLIHKARCRHNSALIRVSNSLGLKHIITGHSSRHTISNHLSQSDFTDDEIRQVLGHTDIKTTKIYLRERIGVSLTMKIMKRFNETHSNN